MQVVVAFGAEKIPRLCLRFLAQMTQALGCQGRSVVISFFATRIKPAIKPLEEPERRKYYFCKRGHNFNPPGSSAGFSTS